MVFPLCEGSFLFTSPSPAKSRLYILSTLGYVSSTENWNKPWHITYRWNLVWALIFQTFLFSFLVFWDFYCFPIHNIFKGSLHILSNLVLFIKRIIQIPNHLCTLLQYGSQESRFICDFFMWLLFSLKVVSKSLVIPRTVAHWAPLSIRFPRQESWSELPFTPPGNPPNRGIKPMSPELADGFLTTETPGKPFMWYVS